MKNFNAVSHNSTQPYFRIQHGRGKVRAHRVYLNDLLGVRNDLLSFGDGNAAGSLETTPRSVVGYSVNIFLPSPQNYVTRSPSCPRKHAMTSGLVSNSNLNTRPLKIHGKGPLKG